MWKRKGKLWGVGQWEEWEEVDGAGSVVEGDQAVMGGHWHGWWHCGSGSAEKHF